MGLKTSGEDKWEQKSAMLKLLVVGVMTPAISFFACRHGSCLVTPTQTAPRECWNSRSQIWTKGFSKGAQDCVSYFGPINLNWKLNNANPLCLSTITTSIHIQLNWFIFFFFFFCNRFLLGIFTCSGTHYISQVDLKHTEILLLQSLELYITMS